MFQVKTFCMVNGAFVMIFVPLLNEALALSDLKKNISWLKRSIFTFRNAEIKCCNWCMAAEKFWKGNFWQKVLHPFHPIRNNSALLLPSATLELGFDEWSVHRALSKFRSFNLMTERHETIVRKTTEPACLVITTNFGGNGK